jgi:hypothetical protein
MMVMVFVHAVELRLDFSINVGNMKEGFKT